MKPGAPELLSRGRSAEVYDWGDGKVLKLFNDGTPPQRVKLEAQVAAAVFESALPVPRVYDTIQWHQRHGILFEKIDGHSMLQACIESPQNAAEYGRMLASIQTGIHHTSIEALPKLLPPLIRTLKNSEHLPIEQKRIIVDRLESQTEGFRLCHMDFHPDQVLLTENGPRVIDWETAGQGNPMSDVARTSLILRIGEIPRPAKIARRELDKIRNVLLSNYLDGYFASHAKESDRGMAVWDLVAAIIRLAEAIDGEQRQLKQMIAHGLETCFAS